MNQTRGPHRMSFISLVNIGAKTTDNSLYQDLGYRIREKTDKPEVFAQCTGRAVSYTQGCTRVVLFGSLILRAVSGQIQKPLALCPSPHRIGRGNVLPGSVYPGWRSFLVYPGLSGIPAGFRSRRRRSRRKRRKGGILKFVAGKLMCYIGYRPYTKR